MENFTAIQGTTYLIISFSGPGKDASSKHHFPNLIEYEYSLDQCLAVDKKETVGFRDEEVLQLYYKIYA